MFFRYILLFVAIVYTSFWPTFLEAQDIRTIPEMKAWVSDFTDTLKPQQLQILNENLKLFKNTQGSQIAVLIVPTTSPENIEDYSIRLAEKWKVGRAGTDDGVILLVAKNDRKLRVEVGYGAEALIPDAKAKQIIEEQIVPHFKSGNFYEGISSGINSIQVLLKKGDLPPAVESDSPENNNEIWIRLASFAMVFIVFTSAFTNWKVRFLISSITALVYILITWLIFDMLIYLSLFMGFFIFFFVFIGGFIFGRRGSGKGGSGSSSSGGYSSGSSSFSSSSFSSGGGSFGGGGSSGSW